MDGLAGHSEEYDGKPLEGGCCWHFLFMLNT